MTECERILTEGILPASFFEPETRCDFLVDADRKKLWAIIIDLLIEFDRVCKAHNLTYTLLGGSLLGVIRHKGFVPWDDDLDVVMPRSDYEKFLSLGNEFGDPYFLQTPYTDKGYFFAHARLRNCNTTFIQRPFCYCEYNMGVFIDILPFDEFSSGMDGEIAHKELTELIVLNSTYMKLSNRYPNPKDKERISRYPEGLDPFDTFERIQKLAKSFSGKDTGYYCLTCGVVYGFRRGLYKKDLYDGTIDGEFEGFHFPIPSGYDGALRVPYGNYMELPPAESRGAWHGTNLIDVDHSYKEVKETPYYKEWSRKQY